MSWLGSGISQITGQISNFTKEVLTEGTEEIDDHATELRLAKAKVNDLEVTCYAQKTELERMRTIVEELTENLESSELQITAISSEYREKLQHSQAEVKLLKQQHNEMLDNQSKMAVATATPAILPHSSSAPTLHALEPGGADDYDFDDVISSQHEINRLRSELQRVEAECRHWKQTASKHVPEHEGQSDVTNVAASRNLKHRIKELEQQLIEEVDSHQRELAALQDVHSQKVAALKKRHKEEAREHDNKVEEEKRNNEEEVARLKEDLVQLRRSHEEDSILFAEADNQNFGRTLREGRLPSSTPLPAGKHGPTVNAGDVGTESTSESFILEFSELSLRNQQLDDQVRHLQEQVDKYEREIEQFELVRSDWECEKEALEGVLVKMRGDLREREDQLNVVQAQKGLMEVEKQEQQQAAGRLPPEGSTEDNLTEVSDLALDLAQLDQQVELLAEGNAQLESERDVLINEKTELVEELEKYKIRLADLEEQLNKSGSSDAVLEKIGELTAELDKKNHHLKVATGELKENQAKLAELSHCVDQKDKALGEREAQVQQLQEQLNHTKQQLDVSERSVDSGEERDLSAELDLRSQQLQEALARLYNHEQQVEELTKEVEERSTALEDLGIEKEALEASLEELDSQHQVALEQVIQKCHQLQKANETLQSENSSMTGLQNPETSLVEENSSLKEEVSRLKEKLQEVETEASSRVSDEAVEEELAKMRQQLEQQRTHIKSISSEKDMQVSDMSDKLSQGALAINDLHMDKQELKGQVTSLTSKLTDLTNVLKGVKTDKSQLQETCQQLESELKRTKEEMNKSQEIHGSHNVERLQSDLSSSLLQSEQYQSRVAELETELDNVQSQLTKSVMDKHELHKSLDSRLKQSISEKDALISAHVAEISQLKTQVDALESQKLAVQKDLASAEKNAAEKAKQYEAYIQELSQCRHLDESGLEAEHERLMKASLDQERVIRDLESQCDNLKSEVEEAKDMLQATMDGQQQITDIIDDKEREITSLQTENRALLDANEENTYQIKTLQAEFDRLTSVEKQHRINLEEKRKLQAELDHFRVRVRQLETQEQTESIESKTLDIITDLESEITSLTEKNDELEKQSEAYIKEISSLNETIESKEQNIKLMEKKDEKQNQLIKNSTEEAEKQEEKIKSLQQSIAERERDIHNVSQSLEHTQMILKEEKLKGVEKDKDIEKLNQTLDSKSRGTVKEGRSPCEPAPGAQPSGPLQNGYDDQMDTQQGISIEELEETRKIIAQKDDVISEMRKNNGSLLKMLEERSLSLRGDRSLVELHKLETEVNQLRMEKEQILSVLNEKSRECSSLKSEVHKLMNVISAEKQALAKLQEDNNELMQHRNQRTATNQEMTKDAVKNLSRIIRDKDLEVESLQQKNQSLLQVLQETSPDGAHISTVTQERDNLMKQITVFQNDREQIIAALNQKHQEAVAFHSEVQRLAALRAKETEEHDKLQVQYKNLSKQYEDKQQALLKVNNELLNTKQKYAEIDNRYQEMLQRQEEIEFQNRLNTSEQDVKTESGVSELQTDISEPQQQVITVERLQGSPQEDSSVSHQQNSALLLQKTDQITKLTSQLKGVRESLANKEQLVKEKEKQMEQQAVLLQEKTVLLQEKEQSLAEKDHNLGELNGRVHSVEESARHKDAEISALKKQLENRTFQMTGLQAEVTDLRHEVTKLMEQRDCLHAELSLMKEANNHLNVTIGERELELNATREKVATLTQLVQEKEGVEEKGTVDQRMAETEAMQKQAQMFQQERDQAMTSLRAKQMDLTAMENTMSQLGDTNRRLERELQRLRTHLIQIEDGYTQEALGAEEREKELRNRLARAEEKALTSTSAVQSASEAASVQLESLQRQLAAMTESRDESLVQLAASQETAQQYATSLANLQMVLEQFSHEKEQQQAVEIQRYREMAEAATSQRNQLHQHASVLQMQLEETKEALEAAHRLSEQLDRKEEMISALREEVILREKELGKAEQEIAHITSANEGRVDKALVKNLFLGYFHTPSGKRQEVVRLISKVLSFSQEELQQIGADTSGWFGGLFKRSLMAPSLPSSPARNPDGSFSELFVKFLEMESTPTPAMRLPAEQMVKEQQERHLQERSRAKPAFNPFSTPVPAAAPHPVPGGLAGPDSSHILMKPMTATPLPMFSLTDTQSLLPGSGSGSANNSGRSTPASNILKDVLHQ